MIEVDGLFAIKQVLQEMCSRLASQVGEESLFDLRMIAHELLTNALTYGGGAAYLSFGIEGEEVRITVRGEHGFRPPEHVPCADVTAEHGRGLFLVEALSARRDYSERDGMSVFVKIK